MQAPSCLLLSFPLFATLIVHTSQKPSTVTDGSQASITFMVMSLPPCPASFQHFSVAPSNLPFRVGSVNSKLDLASRSRLAQRYIPSCPSFSRAVHRRGPSSQLAVAQWLNTPCLGQRGILPSFIDQGTCKPHAVTLPFPHFDKKPDLHYVR